MTMALFLGTGAIFNIMFNRHPVDLFVGGFLINKNFVFNSMLSHQDDLIQINLKESFKIRIESIRLHPDSNPDE